MYERGQCAPFFVNGALNNIRPGAPVFGPFSLKVAPPGRILFGGLYGWYRGYSCNVRRFLDSVP
jgi:hypothetical protein